MNYAIIFNMISNTILILFIIRIIQLITAFKAETEILRHTVYVTMTKIMSDHEAEIAKLKDKFKENDYKEDCEQLKAKIMERFAPKQEIDGD